MQAGKRVPPDSRPGAVRIKQIVSCAGKHLMPPVANRKHVGVGIVSLRFEGTILHAGDKTVAAAPVALQLGLPIPDVRASKPLQALRGRCLMMIGKAIDMDPDTLISRGQFTALRVAPQERHLPSPIILRFHQGGATPGDIQPPTVAPCMLARQ
ncbi:hypothetical protein D3C78_1317090 [compost metagenome]